MKECYQTEGESIWRHGTNVSQHYSCLIDALRSGTRPEGWRLPDWIDHPELLSRQFDRDTMASYLIWHDCGKPLCRTIDDQGRQHFPDHARISAEAYRRAGGADDIARLIGMDMDIHTLKSDQIEEFASRPEAASLILSGLSEIHSNARMFGGIDSTSFRIKFKQLDRRGRAIINLWKGTES